MMVFQRRDELTRVTGRADAMFFADRFGTRWQVFELDSADGTPCLVFESAAALRRIRTYPADWRALSPEELAALSWTR